MCLVQDLVSCVEDYNGASKTGQPGLMVSSEKARKLAFLTLEVYLREHLSEDITA